MKKLFIISLLIVGCTTEPEVIDRSGTYAHSSCLEYETTECNGDFTEYDLCGGLFIYNLNSDGSFNVDDYNFFGTWTQDNNNVGTLLFEGTNEWELIITFTNDGFYYYTEDAEHCMKWNFTRE